jgi:hypothetical protein
MNSLRNKKIYFEESISDPEQIRSNILEAECCHGCWPTVKNFELKSYFKNRGIELLKIKNKNFMREIMINFFLLDIFTDPKGKDRILTPDYSTFYEDCENFIKVYMKDDKILKVKILKPFHVMKYLWSKISSQPFRFNLILSKSDLEERYAKNIRSKNYYDLNIVGFYLYDYINLDVVQIPGLIEKGSICSPVLHLSSIEDRNELDETKILESFNFSEVQDFGQIDKSLNYYLNSYSLLKSVTEFNKPIKEYYKCSDKVLVDSFDIYGNDMKTRRKILEFVKNELKSKWFVVNKKFTEKFMNSQDEISDGVYCNRFSSVRNPDILIKLIQEIVRISNIHDDYYERYQSERDSIVIDETTIEPDSYENYVFCHQTLKVHMKMNNISYYDPVMFGFEKDAPEFKYLIPSIEYENTNVYAYGNVFDFSIYDFNDMVTILCNSPDLIKGVNDHKSKLTEISQIKDLITLSENIGEKPSVLIKFVTTSIDKIEETVYGDKFNQFRMFDGETKSNIIFVLTSLLILGYYMRGWNGPLTKSINKKYSDLAKRAISSDHLSLDEIKQRADAGDKTLLFNKINYSSSIKEIQIKYGLQLPILTSVEGTSSSEVCEKNKAVTLMRIWIENHVKTKFPKEWNYVMSLLAYKWFDMPINNMHSLGIIFSKTFIHGLCLLFSADIILSTSYTYLTMFKPDTPAENLSVEMFKFMPISLILTNVSTEMAEKVDFEEVYKDYKIITDKNLQDLSLSEAISKTRDDPSLNEIILKYADLPETMPFKIKDFTVTGHVVIV